MLAWVEGISTKDTSPEGRGGQLLGISLRLDGPNDAMDLAKRTRRPGL